MTQVSIEAYQCDGCWWARLIEHGAPVPEGRLPNMSQALLWPSGTEAGARSRAHSFLAKALLAADGVVCAQSGFTLADAAQANTTKLRARYPDGFKLGGGVR